MTTYPFALLAHTAGGEVLHDAGHEFSALGYDSRIIHNGAATAFFAIRTPQHDAHIHLQECYEKGVRIFVIEYSGALEFLSAEAQENSSILLSSRSLEAMQRIAAWHRSRFHLPVVAITGSNGKTIVKEWLYELLKDDYRILRSPRSFNSQLGVPLSVWGLNPAHTLAIFEAGISQPGEMQALEAVIHPQIGIFTNIGDAHSANFSGMDKKIHEKLLLFKNASVLIYNQDEELLQQAIHEAQQSGFFDRNIRLLGWSYSHEAPLKLSLQGNILHYHFGNVEDEVWLPYTDPASVANFSHCLAAALLLHTPPQYIRDLINRLHPVEMRMELKEGINGCTLLNDSYNSDLQSLSLALDVLNQQRQHTRRTLILSDILQSGRDEALLYQEVAALCREKGVIRFIGIGNAISRHSTLFDMEKAFFATTSEFLQQYNMDSFSHESILIKGSRSFGFEKIAARLEQKTHDTVLEINLDALRHNLAEYKSRLEPGTKIMAMVKAFSYGSGSFEIASVLQYHQCDYLAVAYADEGIYLREHGITMPIMVMNPEPGTLGSLADYRLEPEVYSLRLLDELAEQSVEQLPIHLKLDTGMHRLGFMPSDMDMLLGKLKKYPQLMVRSIFTHLASADVPAQDEYTIRQLAQFDGMYARIKEALGYAPMRHALNTSGIGRFPKAQMDMVRLGIGLYGIDPTGEVQSSLENVSTLKSRISQLRHLKAGETVGYSRAGKVKRPSVIATINLGYADGFSRALGNGVGKVWIKGTLAPVIGSVCMDMTMIDITGIPAAEGDEVIIFGKEHPIDNIAKAMNTIPYEVLTSVGQRVKRVYIRE
jgi:alanine racemase